MLKLDRATRRSLEISNELLGLVHPDGRFRHAKCHPTTDALLACLAAEATHVAVASTDDWRGDVGPCAECGGDVDGGTP